MRRPPLVPLSLLWATAALAQAPAVTRSGDPSVRSDTIYSLAVDPAAYPDQPYVSPLDDGILRYEADGRAVRPGGEIVSNGPSAEQEEDAVADEESPVSVDQRTCRLTLAGVAPGGIVDYGYTIETRSPVRPGDYASSWSIHATRLVRRSRLVLDVPASAPPSIRERFLRGTRPPMRRARSSDGCGRWRPTT